jgi:hypothetical protein
LMSRIRIYDLAKEAGLKSKELADKLAEMGYPIKSPSSTVDDDMAADIRRKVLGKATAEMTDKPIGVKHRGADMPDRGASVVRRRSRDQKEHLARQAEEIAAKAAAEQAAKRSAAEQNAESEVILTAEPGTTAAAADRPQKDIPTAGSGPLQPKRAKGLARIIGQVEIPVAAEEPRRSGAGRTSGSGGAGRPQGQGGGAARPQSSSSPRPPRRDAAAGLEGQPAVLKMTAGPKKVAAKVAVAAKAEGHLWPLQAQAMILCRMGGVKKTDEPKASPCLRQQPRLRPSSGGSRFLRPSALANWPSGWVSRRVS